MPKTFFTYLLHDEIVLKSISGDVELLLGYSAEDFVRRVITLEKIVHLGDSDLLEILFSNGEKNQPFRVTNLRIRHKSGKIKCVRICYKKVDNKGPEGLVLELALEDAILLTDELNDQVVLSNFYAMIENTDDYIYFKDRNHVFTGASQTLLNITHLPDKYTDLIGLTDYEIFSEPLADQYYQLEKKIFNSELSVVKEIQPIIDNAGNKGWVDNRKYPIKNTQGDIIGLFGIARDITQQLNKKVDFETEHYTRSLIESSLAPFITIAMDGSISDVNSATEEVTGLSKDELIGTDFSAYFTDSQRAIEAYIETYLKGSIRDYFLEIKHINGQVTPIMYNASVYRNSVGDTVGIFAAARDISQQRLTEEKLTIALAEAEASNKALKAELISNQKINQQLSLIDSVFESSEPIVITDQKGIICRVNKAFKILTGYEEYELLGESPVILQSGRQGKSFYEQLWGEILETGRWSGEVTDRKKNGDLFLSWLSISQIKNEQGEVINYFAHLSDITQHKNTQSALIRRLHMEELISEIAIKVLGSDKKNINKAINESLMLLGEELLVDQCCLLAVNENAYVYKSHQWTVEAEEEHDSKESSNNKLLCISHALGSRRVIKIDDIDDMSVKLIVRHLKCKEKGIKSLLLVPRLDSTEECNYLFLSRLKIKRAWRKEDISILKVAVNIFYLALYREEIESKNKRLLADLITSQEKERHYLARELHDEMGQLLTAMHMDTTYLQSLESIKGNEEVFNQLLALDKLSVQLISRLRITTRRIRTATLDQLGLIPAIKELVTDWEMHNHSITVKLNLIEKINGITEEVMLTFYRALQEGLTNISKYAKATEVVICLEVLNDSGAKTLKLTLCDNGIGMHDSGKQQGGSGLLGMKERVRAVGGIIKIIHNKVSTGTYIEIKVPTS